ASPVSTASLRANTEPAAGRYEQVPRMQIWVDADACPVVIRDILFRAAERTGITMTLVANKPFRLPLGNNLHFIQVSAGFDAADKRIAELMSSGDLVITAD